MTWESNNGSPHKKNYGRTFPGGGIGVDRSTDKTHIIKIHLDAYNATSDPRMQTVLPVHSRCLSATLSVTEAFTGTLPAFTIQDVTNAANAITIASASLTTLGHSDITSTLSGELHPTTGAGTNDNIFFDINNSGTFAGAGKAVVTLEYIRTTR
jgi:hypothetical protein